MGFEPTRAEHNGLAVHRLNHSATSSHVVHHFFAFIFKSYFDERLKLWFCVLHIVVRRQSTRLLKEYSYVIISVPHKGPFLILMTP